ncbi:MAG: TIGR00730 family Rossman fold protein [Elusimicrobia bacterium]|nr:TIGR00730 family Rossman fold protein [Elusimicrobiota bacterium]
MANSELSPTDRESLLRKIRDSHSFLRAYEDESFLRREELRPVRLQLELQKPEMVLEEHNIRSTIVVFGSARITPPEAAQERVRFLQKELAHRPHDKALRQKLNAAGRLKARSHYYAEAQKFAKLVTQASQKDSKRDYVIVTGGGPGIMEAANRGAFDAGGESVGLNITLPHEQDPNPYVTPELCFKFHYFAIRKMHFLLRCKALVAFPGGFGTLDELFETLTLMQTKKVRPFPILLFGKEFWRRVINFNYLRDQGLVASEDLRLFQYVEKAEDAWDMIGEHWRKNGRP